MTKNDVDPRQEERDAIIGDCFEQMEYAGGIRRFEKLELAALEKLVKLGYALPSEAQNDSPMIGEFLEFMRKFPKATAHGYTVAMSRGDRRVSIEGLEMDDGTREENMEFIVFNRHADELSLADDRDGVTHYWSWWD